MVDVRIEQKSLEYAMRRSPRNLYREFRKAWRKHHQKFVNKMKRERLSGRPGLKRQTGTLARGLVVKTEGSTVGDLAVNSVFTGAHGFFAHVHETGMTIRAKKGPYLSFPIRSGGASRSTKFVGWANVPSVRIPARLGFKKTWDRMMPELVRETNRAIGKALKPEVTA